MDYDFELLGSRDVIGHVTFRLATCGFLQVVNYNHTPILHGDGDTKPQTYQLWPKFQILLKILLLLLLLLLTGGVWGTDKPSQCPGYVLCECHLVTTSLATQEPCHLSAHYYYNCCRCCCHCCCCCSCLCVACNWTDVVVVASSLRCLRHLKSNVFTGRQHSLLCRCPALAMAEACVCLAVSHRSLVSAIFYSSRATFLTQRRGVYDISLMNNEDRPTDPPTDRPTFLDVTFCK